jgi:hypothetical protein
MKRMFVLAVCLWSLSHTVYGSSIKTVYQGAWSNSEAQFLAENRDIIVSSGGENYIGSVGKYNQESEILYYFNLVGVHDFDPLWQKVQEKGLLWTDKNGAFVCNHTYNWYLVDIRSEEWISMVLDYLSSYLNYYDGVMLDECSLLWESNFDSIPDDYNEQEYYIALNTLLSRIKSYFPDKKIIFNGYKRLVDDAYTGVSLLEFADGISFEGFCYRFNEQYIGEDLLIKSLIDFYRSTYVFKKSAVFVNFCNSLDMSKRLFSLANYMLVMSENSYYYFVASDMNADGVVHDWPEYSLDLDSPLGVLYQTNGLLVRKFSKGIVVVNPSSTKEIVFDLGVQKIEKLVVEGGGSLSDPGSLDWEEASGVLELAPESAVIFRL